MRKNKGITLVALIITIIVLLILAGITINLVLGDNGILNRAKTSGEEYTKASIKEEIELGIADIAAELASKNPTQSLTKDAIVNKLPDRMQEELVIENDLTGEYKGYEYWIDDNYVVHIGGKSNSTFKAKIEAKIGTSYFITTVTASSDNGAIVGYIYVVDGVETEQKTENVYTVENLEEDSAHTVKAIAIDEKGNRKETRTITVKVEPRMYLYNQGKENTDTAGGWELDTYTFKSDYPVERPIKNSNSFTLTTSADGRGVAVGTANKIDFTGYKYLKCEVNITKMTRGIYLMAVTNKYSSYDYRLGHGGGTNLPVANGYVIAFDVSSINQEAYISICNQSVDRIWGSFDVTKVWLEK